jgi:hypothetical protein
MGNEINEYLNHEYNKAFNEYFDLLLKITDSLHVLHFKQKIDLRMKTENGSIKIPFNGESYKIDMPMSNGTGKNSHAQLQIILLSIQTLKKLRDSINDFKKGIIKNAVQTDIFQS